MGFILILVILLPYITLILLASNRRLSAWWTSRKLLNTLLLVLGIVAIRLVLFYGVPTLTGIPTSAADLGQFGLPFALLGIIELFAINEIAVKIAGFQPRLEILDDPVILAVSDLILLFTIFFAMSFIVGAARRRDEPKIEVPDLE